MIVLHLVRVLPDGYVAEPRVHLGPYFEIDVTAFANTGEPTRAAAPPDGGVATIPWTAAPPAFEVEAAWPEQYEYEVLVFDQQHERRLVAAVELVSPANKDRPDSRRAFVTKCAALLQQGVAIAIIDLVTNRQFNLYAELLEWIGHPDPALGDEPPAIYASTLRFLKPAQRSVLQTWPHSLTVGQPLPNLPLWLSSQLAVPLELEASYEDTCRVLRIV
jgi:hypothetical protein